VKDLVVMNFPVAQFTPQAMDKPPLPVCAHLPYRLPVDK
jgi:hypothetical protein